MTRRLLTRAALLSTILAILFLLPASDPPLAGADPPPGWERHQFDVMRDVEPPPELLRLRERNASSAPGALHWKSGDTNLPPGLDAELTELQARAMANDPTLAPTIDVDARFEGSPYRGYGLFFAAQGNDYYRFIAWLDSGTCAVVKSVNNSRTVLQSTSCNLNVTANHLRVEWQAPVIRTYVNGQLTHDLTDGSFSGTRDIGVITAGKGDARFDNFAVHRQSP